MVGVLVDKNGEPPLHVHHGEDESFYVLEGRVTVHVGHDVLGPPTSVASGRARRSTAVRSCSRAHERPPSRWVGVLGTLAGAALLPAGCGDGGGEKTLNVTATDFAF